MGKKRSVSATPASGPVPADNVLTAEIAIIATTESGRPGAGGFAQQRLQASFEVVGRHDHEAPRRQVRGEKARLQPVGRRAMAEEHQGEGAVA